MDPSFDHNQHITHTQKQSQVGPISLADFMDVCLAHPEHGYYMHAETAKIGKAGDFVTAPEISQMFGELLGVWTVATWEKLGLPGKGDQ